MAQAFFEPLKETMLKHRQYRYLYIFSRATLNETFPAKYDGVLPLSETKIRNLYSQARRRASPPLSYAESPPGFYCQ